MRVASRMEPGMFSENCFIRNTPNGQPTVGKITAHKVLCRPRKLISFSRGMRITCLGSAMAMMKMEKMTVRPANCFLAMA